jgi:hypothetical protein
LGDSGEVSRFEALRSGETPLVGREEEVELGLGFDVFGKSRC